MNSGVLEVYLSYHHISNAYGTFDIVCTIPLHGQLEIPSSLHLPCHHMAIDVGGKDLDLASPPQTLYHLKVYSNIEKYL